jgi:hypothetical protein
VEAALAEPRCFPLKKNRTASPHPKTALLHGRYDWKQQTRCLKFAQLMTNRQHLSQIIKWLEAGWRLTVGWQ